MDRMCAIRSVSNTSIELSIGVRGVVGVRRKQLAPEHHATVQMHDVADLEET
jgi:hypothetical protein